MRVLAAAGLVGAVVGLVGCHSAYVDAVVRNRTAETVTLVEVDYPSASFGTQTLAAGQDFHYRFKVLGSGNVKLLWTDTKHAEQHSDGPQLDEGEEGSLGITLAASGVQWDAKVGKR